MENILEIESAIRFCDYKIKEYADKQSRILSLGAKSGESEEYKKENQNRLDWFKKKWELERLMEQKVLLIEGIKK
ncbi:MAG TPA: hypothetical protein VLF89_04110 [Candidatus Saccharimonadales bacterium]|nr:hypothetical protein [Candidatus Saccharimonadales bacterium]